MRINALIFRMPTAIEVSLRRMHAMFALCVYVCVCQRARYACCDSQPSVNQNTILLFPLRRHCRRLSATKCASFVFRHSAVRRRRRTRFPPPNSMYMSTLLKRNIRNRIVAAMIQQNNK